MFSFKRKVLIGGWLILIGGLAVRMLTLQIKTVTCEVNGAACPAEVMASAQSVLNTFIFFSDVEAQVIHHQDFPVGYQVQQVQRLLPQTVVVKLAVNPPVYTVLKKGTSDSLIIDHEGHTVAQSGEVSGLPQVWLDPSLWDEVHNSSGLSPEVHDQLEATITALAQEEISFRSLEISSPTTVLVALDEQRSALLDFQQPIRDVKKLSLVLKGLGPDKLEAVQEIDVRYRLPVLRQTRSISRHDSH